MVDTTIGERIVFGKTISGDEKALRVNDQGQVLMSKLYGEDSTYNMFRTFTNSFTTVTLTASGLISAKPCYIIGYLPLVTGTMTLKDGNASEGTFMFGTSSVAIPITAAGLITFGGSAMEFKTSAYCTLATSTGIQFFISSP